MASSFCRRVQASACASLASLRFSSTPCRNSSPWHPRRARHRRSRNVSRLTPRRIRNRRANGLQRSRTRHTASRRRRTFLSPRRNPPRPSCQPPAQITPPRLLFRSLWLTFRIVRYTSSRRSQFLEYPPCNTFMDYYFSLESSAACAAPCKAPRRPGAFASAVSNSLNA